MSTALVKQTSVPAERRLANAIGALKADLDEAQRKALDDIGTKPTISDAKRLIAILNKDIPKAVVGPRLVNFIESSQRYAGLGNICGSVWAPIQLGITAVASHASYVEQISSLLMRASLTAPQFEALSAIYSESKPLQLYITEYYIVIIQLCHRMLKFSQSSKIKQVVSSLSEEEVKFFTNNLTKWCDLSQREISILLARSSETERRENATFRSLISQSLNSKERDSALSHKRLSILRACSEYEHLTTYKQIRRKGKAAFYKSVTAYNDWCSKENVSYILITGKLGSGKSVALANIVDDLYISKPSESDPVLCFFCRDDVEESLEFSTISGSLVRQLLESQSSWEATSDLRTLSQPLLDVEALLKLINQLLPQRISAYLVFDGLDECAPASRLQVIKFLRSLQQYVDLSICISVREEPDNDIKMISEHFKSIRTISMSSSNPDIESFIDMQLDQDLEAGNLNLGDQTIILDIRDALIEENEGMFLWVSLQIKTLCSMQSDNDIRSALKDLPKDLPETYSRILHKYGLNSKFQKRILQLVATARRPLTTHELKEAVSVVIGTGDWDPSKAVNDVYSILTSCGGLVVIEEEALTVHFVHQSVKQFLPTFIDLNGHQFTMQNANEIMAGVIVTYLSYDCFDMQLNSKAKELETGAIPSAVADSILKTVISPELGKTNSIARKLLHLKSKKKISFDASHAITKISRRTEANEMAFVKYAKVYFSQHIVQWNYFTSQRILWEETVKRLLLQNTRTADEHIELVKATMQGALQTEPTAIQYLESMIAEDERLLLFFDGSQKPSTQARLRDKWRTLKLNGLAWSILLHSLTYKDFERTQSILISYLMSLGRSSNSVIFDSAKREKAGYDEFCVFEEQMEEFYADYIISSAEITRKILTGGDRDVSKYLAWYANLWAKYAGELCAEQPLKDILSCDIMSNRSNFNLSPVWTQVLAKNSLRMATLLVENKVQRPPAQIDLVKLLQESQYSNSPYKLFKLVINYLELREYELDRILQYLTTTRDSVAIVTLLCSPNIDLRFFLSRSHNVINLFKNYSGKSVLEALFARNDFDVNTELPSPLKGYNTLPAKVPKLRDRLFGVELSNSETLPNGGYLHFLAQAKEWHSGLDRIVKLLVNHRNIKLNAVNGLGETALHTACRVSNVGFAESFLKACSPDGRNKKEFHFNWLNSLGETALIIACRKREIGLIELIFRHGDYVNMWSIDQEGNTAIKHLLDAKNIDSNPAVCFYIEAKRYLRRCEELDLQSKAATNELLVRLEEDLGSKIYLKIDLLREH